MLCIVWTFIFCRFAKGILDVIPQHAGGLRDETRWCLAGLGGTFGTRVKLCGFILFLQSFGDRFLNYDRWFKQYSKLKFA